MMLGRGARLAASLMVAVCWWAVAYGSGGCSSTTGEAGAGGGGAGDGAGGDDPGDGAEEGGGDDDGDGIVDPGGALITFTPVGTAFPNVDLIDVEFLPSGESIVIGQDGTVYYVRDDFTPLADTETIDVLNSGEQGLLNVEADPDYATNRFLFFYHTLPDGSGNTVVRRTVTVDVDAGTFSLGDPQTILTALKGGPTNSPDPGDNHNGGGLAFDPDGNLYVGVGDGGGNASSDTDPAVNIGQRTNTRLGKILRVVPNRIDGADGFTVPAGNCGSCTLPEIYAYGLRNPFTLVFGAGGLFIGDVGNDEFEEIDFADAGGRNFGWPESEGPTADPAFRTPLHSYSHTSTAFPDEDEEARNAALILKDHNGVVHPSGRNQSVMVGAFYDGPRYGGRLNDRLIYSEFYAETDDYGGWVRGLEPDGSNGFLVDEHLGHLAGMTSLQEGPDGFLYAVSLYGADRILRLDLNE